MPPSWIRALIGCRVVETSTPRRQSGCDDLPRSYDIMRHNLLRQGLYDRRYLDVTRNGLVRQLRDVLEARIVVWASAGFIAARVGASLLTPRLTKFIPYVGWAIMIGTAVYAGYERISRQRSIGTNWKTVSTTPPIWRCSAWASPWPGSSSSRRRRAPQAFRPGPHTSLSPPK